MKIKSVGFTIALMMILGFLTVNYFALPTLADTAACGSGSCRCSCKGQFCDCQAQGGNCFCFCVWGDTENCGFTPDQ